MWSRPAPSRCSEYEIAEDEVDAELERFHGAVQKSERQLRKLKSKADELHGAAAEELGFLLDAHMQMLTGSRVVRGVESRIREHAHQRRGRGAGRDHRGRRRISPRSTTPISRRAPTTCARSATACCAT